MLQHCRHYARNAIDSPLPAGDAACCVSIRGRVFYFTPDAIALCAAIAAAMPSLPHRDTVATDYELSCSQSGDGE